MTEKPKGCGKPFKGWLGVTFICPQPAFHDRVIYCRDCRQPRPESAPVVEPEFVSLAGIWPNDGRPAEQVVKDHWAGREDPLPTPGITEEEKAQVRKWHRPRSGVEPIYAVCDNPYPCPTIRGINELEYMRGVELHRQSVLRVAQERIAVLERSVSHSISEGGFSDPTVDLEAKLSRLQALGDEMEKAERSNNGRALLAAVIAWRAEREGKA